MGAETKKRSNPAEAFEMALELVLKAGNADRANQLVDIAEEIVDLVRQSGTQ